MSAVIRAIAWCEAHGAGLVETSERKVCAGLGLEGDPRGKGKRGLTLLSVESWRDVCAALNAPLPWTLRRANVLIEGLELAATIGHTLQLGEVLVHVHGETKPCATMDRQHEGLRCVLEPCCRGGVHAEVLADGVLRVGAAVRPAAEAGHEDVQPQSADR